MSSILSKSRFSRNAITQLLLFPPSPHVRHIPSKSRNYSQSAHADSKESSRKILKMAVWSSIGACSIAFFAFQTGYFDKIIDKTGYFDKIIDKKDHVSDQFADKDNIGAIAVNVETGDGIQPHDKVGEDLDPVDVVSEDSDSVSPSSEGEFIPKKFKDDSVVGEDSDSQDSVLGFKDRSDVKEDEVTITPSLYQHVEKEDTQQPLQEKMGKAGVEHSSFVDEYYLREGYDCNAVPSTTIDTTDGNENAEDEKARVSELKEVEFVDSEEKRVPDFIEAIHGTERRKDDLNAQAFQKEKEICKASVSEPKEVDSFESEEKRVLGFIEAIHAAERRQADLDAQAFHKEKEILKNKYENELADARAKELMYAEEMEILDKELYKERVRAEEALESCRDEAEAKLKLELEQKDREAELKLKKLEELGKAELIGAVIREKASHLKKIEEANLHINALCMAFYAQNTEAEQTQSVHKLALWANALEDALSEGLPIEEDIHATCHFLEGKDTVVDLVLSSLSKEAWSCGTDNLLQLHQKFDALKGILRHCNLVPPGSSGFLAHSMARAASFLKVKEKDWSGDGIESAMNRVERLLLEGKLSEAADTLEEATRGTQAADVILEWVERARNRAIFEQALDFLKSYAASVSLYHV